MKKRGELTTKQLVTLIILIMSFAVILFLLVRLDLGQVTDGQVCHNSVVMQSKNLIRKATDPFNFNCKTRNICVYDTKECGGVFDETFEIDENDPVKSKALLKSLFANESARCWKMFGEGKLDFSSGGGWTTHCAVCSSISFSKNFSLVLSYAEFFSFLSRSRFDGPKTYDQYLFPGNVDWIKGYDSVAVKNGYATEKISFDEKYFIFLGINPEAWMDDYLPVQLAKSSELKQKGCEALDLTTY
jgi:hypothetical protein